MLVRSIVKLLQSLKCHTKTESQRRLQYGPGVIVNYWGLKDSLNFEEQYESSSSEITWHEVQPLHLVMNPNSRVN